MRVLMVAGEVSGDLQGASLARALKAQSPQLNIIGVGGVHMKAAGVDLRAETTHLASVGFLEPLRYFFPTQSIFKKLRSLIDAERPSCAILIDNPGFNYALARYLRRRRIPVIYFFPPQVWVGSYFFASAVARVSRLIISAFNREAEIYRQHGAHAISLGHPLVDIVKARADAATLLTRKGIEGADPLVALMPGSRKQEVRSLSGPMLRAARLILDRHPKSRFVLPVASPHLKPRLEAEIAKTNLASEVLLICDDVYSVLSRCAVVITASGTSTLEAALLGVPMVVCYRIDAVSGWIGRLLNSTPYVAMPNILLGDEVVSELMQRDATPSRIAIAAMEIIENPDHADRIRSRLRQLHTLLGPEGVIDRVATRVLEELDAFSSGELKRPAS